MLNKPATIGETIAMLDKFDDDKRIAFDFAGLTPHRLFSYRGYYEDLAIGYFVYWMEDHPAWDYPDSYRHVGELKDALQLVVDKSIPFEGYKGGWFTYNKDSFLWISDESGSQSTSISGVYELPHDKLYHSSEVIINTDIALRPDTESDRAKRLAMEIDTRPLPEYA